jgi:hypothetical protein
MNNIPVEGKNLLVEEARPKEPVNALKHARLYIGTILFCIYQQKRIK